MTTGAARAVIPLQPVPYASDEKLVVGVWFDGSVNHTGVLETFAARALSHGLRSEEDVLQQGLHTRWCHKVATQRGKLL